MGRAPPVLDRELAAQLWAEKPAIISAMAGLPRIHRKRGLTDRSPLLPLPLY